MKLTRAGWVVSLLVSVALMCGSGAAVVAFSQRWLPNAGLPAGYTALVCTDVQLAPPRLESSVVMPQLRSVSALFHLPGRCAWLPWLPALLHNLHFQLPP